jgi:hypothetical protein
MEMAPCKYLRLIAAAPTRGRRAPPKSNSSGREKTETEETDGRDGRDRGGGDSKIRTNSEKGVVRGTH